MSHRRFDYVLAGSRYCQVLWTSSPSTAGIHGVGVNRAPGAGSDCSILAWPFGNSTPALAAEAKEVYSTGLTEQNSFAPQYHLAGVVADVGNIYTKRIQAAMDGTWKPEDIMFDATDGNMGITEYGPEIPEELRTPVDQATEGFKTAELDTWTRPMKDQEGTIMVPEGHRMTIEKIQSVDWLEEGIKASLPDQRPVGRCQA